MKFVCDSIDLSYAAGTVVKACAVRTLTPVLECIRMQVKNERRYAFRLRRRTFDRKKL